MKKTIKLTTDDQNTLMGEAMDNLYEGLGYDDADQMYNRLCGENRAWPHHTDEFRAAGFETLSTGQIIYSDEDATEDDARREFRNLCQVSLSKYHTVA